MRHRKRLHGFINTETIALVIICFLTTFINGLFEQTVLPLNIKGNIVQILGVTKYMRNCGLET